jgi:hypothetical protein
MTDEGMKAQKMGFPTILVFDQDDKLVGFCGTRIYDKMIVAGPLVVRTDYRRLFTIMRLCEAYESAMSQIGVETFILSVEHGSILQRGMERYFPDQEPYATEDGYDFYTWKVRSYGQQGQRSRPNGGGEGPPAEPGGAVGSSAPDH